MLAPDSLIYLSERTSRSNANSILDNTNVRTKKVAKQFFSRKRNWENISTFRFLQKSSNRREEIKTTGRLKLFKKEQWDRLRGKRLINLALGICEFHKVSFRPIKHLKLIGSWFLEEPVTCKLLSYSVLSRENLTVPIKILCIVCFEAVARGLWRFKRSIKMCGSSGINAPIQRFVTWPAPMTKCSSLSQGAHTLICKLQMKIKWEIKTYLFCSWICCGAKWNENCSTMQKRCLCRRFVKKSSQSGFILRGLSRISLLTAVPLINNQQWRQIT